MNVVIHEEFFETVYFFEPSGLPEEMSRVLPQADVGALDMRSERR